MNDPFPGSPTFGTLILEHPHLMGSYRAVSRLGSGSGWRVSTLLIRSLEALRQTVRPPVVRRRDGCWDAVPHVDRLIGW
jgi:hypothetical protein